jgi:SAM-dependent methyltransferase
VDTLCTICGSSTRSSDDHEYVRCVKCGTVRTRFGYSSKVYSRAYAKNYVAYAASAVNVPLNLFRLGLVSRWMRPGQLLMDVGCCIGEFLRFAEKYYQCVGIEPNKFAVSMARKRVESPIMSDMNEITGKFKCITMFDVLEHIEEPKNFLKFIVDTFLDKDGVIALTTPNVDAIPQWSTELQKWKHYKPEEHLFLHTEFGLDTLINSVGLTSLHWGREESDIRPGNPNGDILTLVAGRQP